MKAGKLCPVCVLVRDKSHDWCPEHEGVILIRVYDYGNGFVQN